MAPHDNFSGSLDDRDRQDLPEETRRADIEGLPADTATGLYLNDLLYYNQEELVRRCVPVHDQIDEDYERDDNFPEEWEDDELTEYYEPHTH